MKFSKKEPVLWHLSFVQVGEKYLISGQVVEEIKPYSIKCNVSFILHFKSIIKSYFYKPLVNKNIIININDSQFYFKTDNSGGFNGIIDFVEIKKYAVTIVDEKEISIKTIDDYPVVFNNSNSKTDLITDIDDTILKSYTLKFFKRVGTILFTTPQNRKHILFSKLLLQKINEKGGRVFYVSKSESNLLPLLKCFVKINGFPEGAFNLTDFKSVSSLLFRKKKKDVKFDKIEEIVKLSNNKKFILLGDDTQKDIDIFDRVFKKYPEKIAKIYIHKTVKGKNRRIKAIIEDIEKNGIPVTVFDNSSKFEKELEFLKNI